MIARIYENILPKRLFLGKTLLLTGPRQAGKTLFIEALTEQLDVEKECIWCRLDNPQEKALLEEMSPFQAQKLFDEHTVLVIDGLEGLENGLKTLKMLQNSCPKLQILATTTHTYELSNNLNDELKELKDTLWTYPLLPLSFEEVIRQGDWDAMSQTLEKRMIYGSYPEVVQSVGEEKEVLTKLLRDYLYKDILALRDVRKPEAMKQLLQLLAIEIGNVVSYRKLADRIDIDKETIERYIQLLEQYYIVFRLPSYAQKVPNELGKSRKIYFVDTGIRNAILQQFTPLSLRQDIDALWENFLIAERIKLNFHQRKFAKSYFWQTTQQQSIDYLEIHKGILSAYQFCWHHNKKRKFSKTFTKNYSDSPTLVIDQDNYIEFVFETNSKTI